ncbi:RagB/SusD family nutrient uptake outer membrane protein [Mucilaginibacter sp.]|uniref:RagB/SusD family nutrient uptake outer membrane protein n=1 Tax=Mucilaginibacter sp. TaxID=1882438 RepID=UPI0032635A0F
MRTLILKYKPIVYGSIIALMLIGCKKQDDFLNTKPNQALETLTSLSDVSKLLNNEDVFNRYSDPGIGEIASDDLYIQDSAFGSLSLSIERNAYMWANKMYDATSTQVADWNNPYEIVYYANTVLDALPGIGITGGNQDQYNQIKGAALFYRSFAFYNLVQTFAMPYDAANSGNQPGIPLRLTSDINSRPQRASESECYNQIVSDLKTSINLLPVIPAYKTQPSQPAANALLARIYLAMGNYPSALQYANACLDKFNTLSDYNTLTSTPTAISNNYIAEDIYHCTMVNYSPIAVRRSAYIDSALYGSYSPNDLRKTKFFTILDGLPQYPRFVGSYDFKNSKYSGLAADEVFLIKAECLVRSGDISNGMSALNTLLVKRWKTGTFVPLTASGQDEALKLVLLERRKELLWRGIRWTDLRRLNKENGYNISIKRLINATSYILAPNDVKYAFPIPDIEIQLGGLTQNPR